MGPHEPYNPPRRGQEAADSDRATSLAPQQTQTDEGNFATAEPAGVDRTRAASSENYSSRARFDTFARWPGRGLPRTHDMTMAGFYYMGVGDCVRCFYCGVTLRNWREGDDPWVQHVRYRFSCEYLVDVKGERFILQASAAIARGQIVSDVTNSFSSGHRHNTPPDVQSHTDTGDSAASSAETNPVGQSQTSEGELAADSAELAGLDRTRAASPENWSISARLDTYACWPRRRMPRPRDLVSAGFYYTGSEDCVRCFYCGVTLRNWRGHDDPWVMHVRYRFSCEYVAATRGERFVRQASEAVAREPVVSDGTRAHVCHLCIRSARAENCDRQS